MFRTFFVLALAAPLAISCTDSSSTEDEFAADDLVEISDDAKADLGATSTYYQVKADFRRCASPMCGGVFYKLANAETTRCLDGRKAERCYAASTDWARLGLNDGGVEQATSALYAGDLIVRASIGRKNWSGVGTFAELRPTEAWAGEGANVPSGVFTKVELTGVRCITTPCPTFREGKLNSRATANLAELGWDASGATQEQLDAASAELTGNKLIIVGDRYTVTGPAGSMAARTVVNFYKRIADVEPAGISVETSDWNAWISRFAPSPTKFLVTGTVNLPSPGYTATLVPATPQGINPADLILDLKIEQLDGFFPQVITPVEVRYEQSPYSGSYSTVLVREPDGDAVALSITTAF